MRTYKALGSNLIIKVENGEVKTKSGFIIAAEGTRESQAREEGIIEQVGEDAFNDLGKVVPKAGDRVVIARYDGKSLGKFNDGFERRILKDTSALAIIEGSDDE